LFIKRNWIDVAVVCITLCTFLIAFDWGLPSGKRVELLGGSDVLEKNIDDIQLAAAKDRVGGNLDYQETIHRAAFWALVGVWAGDDHIALKGISNLDPGNLQFDPKHYIYGGPFIYTGAAFLLVAKWLNLVTLVPEEKYYLRNPSELGKIAAVLRFMVVLFATAGLYLVYRFAKKQFDQSTALLSWAIVLVNPETQASVRTIEPHIFVLVFFLAAFIFILRSIHGNTRRNIILAAICTGVTIGTQSTALYIIFPFFVSLWINYKNKVMSVQELIKHLLIFGAIALTVLIILNPYYLLNFEGFVLGFNRGTDNQLFENPGWWYAPHQISWFLLIGFLIAIGYQLAISRTKETSVLLLSAVLPAMIVYLGTGHIMQYIYSSLALMTILLVITMKDLCSSLIGAKKWVAICFLSILVVCGPMGRSAYYVSNFTAQNREAAGSWINENVPAGETIAMRWPPTLWDNLAFNYYKYNIVNYKNIDEGQLPEVVVLMQSPLPSTFKDKYSLIAEYVPNSVFGYHYPLMGEVHALIAKTIKIYRLHGT
jgi:hypothetical protein